VYFFNSGPLFPFLVGYLAVEHWFFGGHLRRVIMMPGRNTNLGIGYKK
jgi:hypothetical protein